MSLYGSMSTSISGMQAQTNKLSSVGDNIANASTTGFKSSSAEFSSMVMPTYNQAGGYSNSNYQSGFVDTTIRRSVTQQGELSYTSSDTNLAIVGQGFFVVQDTSGRQYLSRAGDFQKDDQGYLVSSGGYRLTGYSYDASGAPSTIPEAMTLGKAGLSAKPSTHAIFDVNLPKAATAVDPSTSSTPASNQANSAYTDRTSMTAYDNAGGAVMLDIYYTKTGDNNWEVSVFNRADATNGGFPYGTAGSAPMATTTLTIDPATTKLTQNTVLDVAIPGGQTVALDMSGTTQLASGFSVTQAKIDGSKVSAPNGYSISSDGLVSAKYADGTVIPIYTVALADVMSPNNMTAVDGTAFLTNNRSGPMVLGTPGLDGMGTIKSGAYENSNVDLAGQMTDMIESQRVYTANSKVYQTGSEMWDVINNLKK